MTSRSDVRRARLSPSSSRSVMSLASFWMNSERVRSSVSSCAPRSASRRSLSCRVLPNFSTLWAREPSSSAVRRAIARGRLGLELQRLALLGLRARALGDARELGGARLHRHLRHARLALELVVLRRELARAALQLDEADALRLDGAVELGETRLHLVPFGVE